MKDDSRMRHAEARVTYWLKVLALIALAVLMLSYTIQFLERIAPVTIILVGTVFFTYLIYPAVHWLRSRGLSKGGAIAFVYVSALVLFAFALSFIVPPFLKEIKDLTASMPAFVRSASAYIANPDSPGLRYLPMQLRDYLATLPVQLGDYVQTQAAAISTSILSIVLSAFGIVATLVVIPILSIYLIFEAEGLTAAAVGLMPITGRPETLRVLADLDKVLGGFIRGQVIVGATIGICITVGLTIVHVPYALVIGIAAGVLDIIPYIGAVATFIPAVVLGFQSGGWQHAVIVALIFVAVFQAEGHFISPRIVSESVGLSPLVVIVAVLVGGELLGIPGMFIAVPVAGVLRVLRQHFVPTRAPAHVPEPAAVRGDT